MMDKHYLSLIIKEVRNFKKLQKQWGYYDIDDLIGHYIEEDVISTPEELKNILKTLKVKLGIKIKGETFNIWW